ncbi:MAG: Uma2 family endonuclease [Tepidisphaeraceae bacterium]
MKTVTRTAETSSKPFEPGTTGWTASDLDDPAIEREWFRGRYEIVEGVLTKMAAAYFSGGESLFTLMVLTREHVKKHGPRGSFAGEVDIIIDGPRVAVADAVFLTPEQRVLQAEASRRAGKTDPNRTRILIPPLLIIESVSPGHEAHDHRTKRRWYAEFGVPNYWLLDAYRRSLDCLVLDGGEYRVDQAETGEAEIRPSLFPGLVIPLRELWQS